MPKTNILEELKNNIAKKIPPAHVIASALETPPEPPASKEPREKRPRAPKAAAREVAPRSGRGIQFYLEDTDRKIIRSLALWFSSQDRRVSDSQVVKAAIRFAEAHQGSKLLDLCDEVRSGDRRLQKKD